MSTASLSGRPWAKSILFPLWILQYIFTLVPVGIDIAIIITDGYHIPITRRYGFGILLVSHFISLAVVAAQLYLLVTQRLTPLTMLLSQTVMTCYWTAIVLIVILSATGIVYDGIRGGIDISMYSCATASVYAILVYTVVVFRREGSGLFLPAEDGSRAEYSAEEYQRVQDQAQE